MNAEERKQRDEEIARIAEEMRKAIEKPIAVPPESSSEEEEESSSEEEEEVTVDSFPVHFEVAINGSSHHTKAIKQIAWDANCSRLVTGSLDGATCLWDTSASITSDTKPFRELSLTSATTGTATDQAVVSLDFNKSNQLIAVGRRDPQIRIFDRDGTNGRGALEAKYTTTSGDMYLRDMKKTKGHVGAVSQVSFSHVKEQVMFSSGELDGTIRMWDVENGPKALMGLELACTHTLLYASKPGVRNSIYKFCHNEQSTVLYAAAARNELHMWDSRTTGAFGAMPSQTIRDLLLSSTTAEYQSLHLNGQTTLLASKRDLVEARDVRNLKQVLWQYKPPSSSMVRGVANNANHAAVTVALSNALCFLRIDTGEEIGVCAKEQHAITSNLVVDNRRQRYVRGAQDGSLIVSFAKDYAPPLPLLPANNKRSSNNAEDSFYARVDRSKVEGEIMPASEALKLVKGTKRVKNDLRDDI